MEVRKGYVEHIVFRNNDNGYTVFQLVSEEEELTCVGLFSVLAEGELVQVSGYMKEHPLYGEQLQVEQYELLAPEDETAMERYLGSGAIKGIGAAMAARIVRRFKGDTFRIIEEEPERLAEVKGISEKKAMEISAQMEEKKDLRQAMMFLTQYGISVPLAVKIYQQYGNRTYQVVEENPYRLADDISGIGFKIADEIASRIGIHTDSDYRIRSGLLYVLLQATGEGHTCLPKEDLLHRASALLGVEEEQMETQLMNLCMDRKLVMKEQNGKVMVWYGQYYYMELNVAKMLYDLNLECEMEESQIVKKLSKVEKQASITLDEMQRKAVVEAVKNGVLVITGGPGTGKTTTINAIIRYFETEDMEILLAAPTGRAAKRMTEATGWEAVTIHRLLELSGVPSDDRSTASFERNEENPLEADVIIIDEMSMVDIFLMNALLKAVSVGTRLILVGDINQLPSVGPGCVLKDIIRAGSCPVVQLTRIFRQASQSDIIVNAHKINRGEHVTLDNKSRDFFFLQRQDPNVILRVVLALVQEKMPRYVDARPTDIQVLTPMRKGSLGVENLNEMLQRYLNPPSPEKNEKETARGRFREGDKVMQIKNNYQIEWEARNRYGIAIDKGTGIFNGDMGIVQQIDLLAETMEVLFDDYRTVTYSFQMLEELELAYAVTIHKSQGSEYPAVVIPLLTGPRMLMNRNLLYTAVTRARSCVTLVGSPETFAQMIDNASEQTRYSGLYDRIREVEGCE
ncbi:ATP-dependent RecD-like DNA helicase [Clostridiaceae bacterium AF42-6]|nr:ATP-dependent RecD-like DNA helicase [Clostridiaceae bacterium AF42-6]RHP50505.1 ATP-dependent RecD-like DNA helicase [Clostridiaceae bacterium AF31-3BH]RHQ24636.1 ATP-dependent RecD-like DNA helicase [Clostridiaceae bacterium AF29-16BH]